MNAPMQHTRLPSWPMPDSHPVMAMVERRDAWSPPRAVHVIPSLSLGGAERIVLDLAESLARQGIGTDVVVIRDSAAAHAVPEVGGLRIHRVSHLPWQARTDHAAALIRDSGLPGYCHLTSVTELQRLWAAGADTVPVVHNARDGWQHDPREWERGRVPFAVACGDRVAEDMRRVGCPVPIVVIRHVPPRPAPMTTERRDAIRGAMGASVGTLLMGMTGRVVAQKAHDRAVEVLARIVSRGHDARLAIVGAYVPGDAAHAAAVDAALRLGVRDRVLFLGAVEGAAGLVAAFDVHINTSRYEGVSIATMEAVLAGVPVVTSDVGGQAEAVGADDALLPPGATAAEFADAVLGRMHRPPARIDMAPRWFRAANACAWPWAAAFRSESFRGRGYGADVLFVTANLDVGGAQRSLGHLAGGMAGRGLSVAIAVSGPLGVPDMAVPAVAAGARLFDLSQPEGGERAEVRFGRILSLVLAERPCTVCFWNMDPEAKAAVSHALSGTGVRVADASPGPALFRELDEASAALRCLSSGRGAYLRSLDAFAAKYAGGLPGAGERPATCAVVRNGVPPAIPLSDGVGPRPPVDADPALAVLVVGRLNATKKTHLLPAIASRLAELVPGATTTVVGGLHRTGHLHGPVPESLHLVGPDTRAAGFAHRFACLLMLSDEQGCPNASLEAMAAGIPVVANDDGGTSEQVVDGVTGRLLPRLDGPGLAEAAAAALAGLLRDPSGTADMGRAARRRVRESFGMDAMVDGYMGLLLPEDGR